MTEQNRKYCRECLSFDGRLNAKVKTTRQTDPATGKGYDGPVCATCFDRGVISRVTCKTFVRADGQTP